MNLDSFTLYLERLKTIRDGLTDPKRIKFIDDIFEALRYKDAIINSLHNERSRLIDVNSQSIQDGLDTKLKLEGCALRYGIPGWEIEKWLRMSPDAAVREVKFWQDWDKQTIELEHLINGTTPPTVYPKKTKYASKPIGLPAGYRIKTEFSLKEVINNLS